MRIDDAWIDTFIASEHTNTRTHAQPCFKAAWAEHRKLHKAGGAQANAAIGADPHARTPQDRYVWSGRVLWGGVGANASPRSRLGGRGGRPSVIPSVSTDTQRAAPALQAL